MEELLTLPGVGRKTANLVLILAHASPENICVDTHVHRIANRLGWVTTRTPEETEQALYRVTRRRWWPVINLYLVTWGQNVCRPVYPLCPQCVLVDICPKVGVTKVGKLVKRRVRRSEAGGRMATRRLAAALLGCVLVLTAVAGAQQKSPGAGPIIVLETVKGTIEFETYPEEAPKTVGRDHRAREEELLQRPALPSRRAELRHPGRRSGHAGRQPAGVVGPAELGQADRRRGDHEEAPARPRRGLDGLSGHRQGRPPTASSSSCAAPRRSMDGKYTVFGKVLTGHGRRREDSARRRAQTSLPEGVGGRIRTSPFRSG